VADTRFAALDWRLFLLSGPDRKSFLHGLVTNDVKGMQAGRELPCCLLTPKGMLQALLWVYELDEALLLVTPSECAGNLEAALRKVLPLSESRLDDASSRWSVFWSGGAEVASAARRLPFSALGDGGSLFLAEPSARADFEKSAGRSLSAAELEALRVERRLPRFGVDVDASTIPLEAGLDWTLSYTKGCYMGQETISRIHHLGHVNRKLVRLRFEGAAPAAPAAVTKNGAEIGRLTSAAGSFGLAMLRVDTLADGLAVETAGRSATVIP